MRRCGFVFRHCTPQHFCKKHFYSTPNTWVNKLLHFSQFSASHTTVESQPGDSQQQQQKPRRKYSLADALARYAGTNSNNTTTLQTAPTNHHQQQQQPQQQQSIYRKPKSATAASLLELLERRDHNALIQTYERLSLSAKDRKLPFADSDSIDILLESCILHHDVAFAERLFTEQYPNVVFFKGIIGSYELNGKQQRQPSVSTAELLLILYCVSGRGRQASQLFQRMVKSQQSPLTTRAINAMLWMFAERGRARECDATFACFATHNRKPDALSLAALIKCYYRHAYPMGVETDRESRDDSALYYHNQLQSFAQRIVTALLDNNNNSNSNNSNDNSNETIATVISMFSTPDIGPSALTTLLSVLTETQSMDTLVQLLDHLKEKHNVAIVPQHLSAILQGWLSRKDSNVDDVWLVWRTFSQRYLLTPNFVSYKSMMQILTNHRHFDAAKSIFMNIERYNASVYRLSAMQLHILRAVLISACAAKGHYSGMESLLPKPNIHFRAQHKQYQLSQQDLNNAIIAYARAGDIDQCKLKLRQFIDNNAHFALTTEACAAIVKLCFQTYDVAFAEFVTDRYLDLTRDGATNVFAWLYKLYQHTANALQSGEALSTAEPMTLTAAELREKANDCLSTLSVWLSTTSTAELLAEVEKRTDGNKSHDTQHQQT